MPSSTAESIPYEIEYIRKNRPNLTSVLDVGIGFGKGGFLIREYFDVKEYQRFQPKDWKVKITGIEIFPSYLSELQRLIYNEIFIGDVFDVLPKLGRFELAILGDIIEHFPKDKGLALLHQLFEHAEDIVIITPMGFLDHPVSGGNKHEEHKSGWTLDDFSSFTVVDCVVIQRIRKDNKVLVVYLRK